MSYILKLLKNNFLLTLLSFMKSKNWVNRQKNDQFVKKAKQLGYINRAAFKLEEIEQKYKIIENSKEILELGSSPGGWTQVILNYNTKTNITCFDLLDMKHAGVAYWLILTLRYVVIFLLFLIILSLIYYFAPTVHSKFSFFSAGSFFSTIFILLVAKLFAFYVDNFGNYNKLYGSIGAMLGLMFFFYAVSLILLIGFQVNASIEKAKDSVSKIK